MVATLDTSGLNCPLPILKVRRAMKEIATGDVLKVLATDPGAARDFEAYCRSSGHELMDCAEQDGIFVFHIKKNV